MFLSIFLFELRYRLRRPATWIYFGLLFLTAFLLTAAAGGAFGEGVKISLGGDGQVVKLNSPHSILIITTVFSVLNLVIISSFMGNPVYRDFEHKTHSLFYTTPITKWGYLGGRFLGSFVITVLVFTGIGLGTAAVTLLPTVQADRFLATTVPGTYIWPYLIMVLPDLFFCGTIFFVLATLTRNILSTYIGSVLLLVAYLSTQSLLSDLDNKYLISALDAFGLGAIEETTRYWTPVEKNTRLLPLSDFILLNRVIWLAVGFGLWAFGYYRFTFSAFASDKAPSKRKRAKAKKVVEEAALPQALRLPLVHLNFTFAQSLRQWWSLSLLEFRGIVRNVYFIAIAGAGALFLISNSSQIGKMFDTSTYPVTGAAISVLSGTFFLFLLAIIIYYSGELVWRERDAQVAQITDATPVPNWVPFLSKLTALSLVQVVLLSLVLVCGVLVQTFKGYFNYELDIYFRALFMHQLPYLLLWVILAMLVQVLVNNKYVGHFVVVLVYVANIFRSQIGLTHRLFGFAGSPSVPHSDMNGFGHFLETFWVLKLYWAGFGILFIFVALLFWVRGTDTTGRWVEARRRLRLPAIVGLLAGLVVAGGTGSFIFYNTNVLNEYRTPKEQETAQANYEKSFRKKYLHIRQPRVVAVKVQTDIYPQERRVHLRGTQTLLNKLSSPLDTIFVSYGAEFHPKVLRLEPSVPASVVENNTDYGFKIFKLKKPLAPTDSIDLIVDLEYQEKGIPNGSPSTRVVENGTFINAGLMPGLGYREDLELEEDKERKEHNLAPKPRMAPRTDMAARGNTYISTDADWIRFETTVSTDPDQTAIAPGYLQKEWVANGRRYFTYKMDRPMLNFYSWLSARYQKYTDKWIDTAGHRTIPVEIYYHKGHEYNLTRMAAGVKEALSYCSANFSPYQHQQVRILEFPNYASFAQSFANTIPFSESIGFIAKVDSTDPDDLDYPLYVAAHEVAHQWWAHQVIGGNVQGSTLMSESMAEYSALMVMKHHYGPYAMQRFLKYDLDRYLSGRSFERKKEVPLSIVENQPYIHYNKGSVVMYALAEYVGETTINKALKEYVQKVAFQGPPYTNSIEFMDNLRRALPDSLQPMVTDLFDKITLYDNRLTKAESKKLASGKYQVTLTIDSKKYEADSLGNQKELTYNDWLPIGIFPEKGKDNKPAKPLLLTRSRLKPGLNTLTFVVDKVPASASVDPYNYIIDRDLEDNKKDL